VKALNLSLDFLFRNNEDLYGATSKKLLEMETNIGENILEPGTIIMIHKDRYLFEKRYHAKRMSKPRRPS
jgi:hypothetical protein